MRPLRWRVQAKQVLGGLPERHSLVAPSGEEATAILDGLPPAVGFDIVRAASRKGRKGLCKGGATRFKLLSGTGGPEFGAVPLSPAVTVDTLDNLDTLGGRGSAGGHCVNCVHCVTCQRMEQRTPPIPHFSASSASSSRGDTW